MVSMSSGLDLKSVYRPPSSLRLPEGESGLEANVSPSEAMSTSSSSPSSASSSSPPSDGEMEEQFDLGQAISKDQENVMLVIE